MAYTFSTDEQRREMLETIGVASMDELLAQVPTELQLQAPLSLPAGMNEWDLEAHTRRLADKNRVDRCQFMGGGAYDHFIPAVVDEVTSRGEFYTAYTPYQPEASQGSLQAFFEFQTLICQLTGMDVANASLYEGGTAVSEAMFMAMRVTGRHARVVVLGSVHPEYRQILETYTKDLETEIVTVPTPGGVADLDQVRGALDDQTACLIIQQPNFFGCLEEAAALCDIAREQGALSVVSVDPISLGVLRRPGEYGADIAVAEGQSLGVPLEYGGPYLGILACRSQFTRKMPGRLISEATDRDGRPCYVLGLQTREQHIRRDKATSNICTNQGLLALRATVFMASLGPQGLREMSERCCQLAHYAADRLQEIEGVELMYPDQPFFKEFALRITDRSAVVDRVRRGGFDIGPTFDQFPTLADKSVRNEGVLIAVTEKRSKAEIDALAGSFTGTA